MNLLCSYKATWVCHTFIMWPFLVLFFLLFVCHDSDLAIGKIFALYLDTGWISTDTNGQSGQDLICHQHKAKLSFCCLLQVINGSTQIITWSQEQNCTLISHSNKTTVRVHYFSGEKNGICLILTASVVYWCTYKC